MYKISVGFASESMFSLLFILPQSARVAGSLIFYPYECIEFARESHSGNAEPCIDWFFRCGPARRGCRIAADYRGGSGHCFAGSVLGTAVDRSAAVCQRIYPLIIHKLPWNLRPSANFPVFPDSVKLLQ